MHNIRIEQQIIEADKLLRDAFGIELGQKVLKYKHFDNPEKINNPIRFLVEDEIVVGMNAFMGMKMQAYGNVHYVSQSCDTAVLTNQQLGSNL